MNSHYLTTLTQRFCSSSIPCQQNPQKPYKPQLVGLPPTISSIRQCADPCFSAAASGATLVPFKICNSRLNRTRASSNDAQSIANRGGSNELREPSFAEFITSERVKVVAMLALALVLCNADRVVMSVAIVPLSLSRGWRQAFGGVVQAGVICSKICEVSIPHILLTRPALMGPG